MPNLIGTGLNQVPINGMLGGLAYQDPEHASIRNLDLKNLSQINSEIADTAVDIFVYDTRKDSDGGAWRKRTQNTSWYNETLGTATRGTRKEFPAVAMIVAENTSITIYDGDDPDLPMWMMFNTVNGMINTNGNNLTSVSMMNGTLVWTSFRSGIISFIPESAELLEAGYAYGLRYGLVNRNVSGGWSTVSGRQIVNNNCNDSAMTVLPNAPIDDTTGLPIPTIAVATNTGVSIIKDDGSVVNISESSTSAHVEKVNFRKDKKLGFFTSGTAGAGGYPQPFYLEIPSSDISTSSFYGITQGNIEKYGGTAWETNNVDRLLLHNEGTSPQNCNLTDIVDTSNLTYAATNQGLNAIIRPEVFGAPNAGRADMRTAAVAYIQNDYNTGYMHGDIKGAFLSDTTTGSISTNEYDGGDFTSNITGWGDSGNTTLSNPNGVLRVLSTANGSWSGATAYYNMGSTFVVGKTYSVTYDMRTGGTTGNYSTGIGSKIQKDNATHSQYTLQSLNLYGNDAPGTSFTTYSWTFVAERTTYGLQFFNYYGVIDNYFEVDNIVIKEAVADRSVNSSINVGGAVNVQTTNGLTVYGSLTKTPVATGSDLVAYSNFNTSNHLRQPPNSDMNIGTGDAYEMIWYKTTATTGTMMMISYEGGANGTNAYGKPFNIRFHYGGVHAWASHDSFASWDDVYHGVSTADGVWHCAAWVRRGPVFELYVDGELIGSDTGAVGSNALSDENSELVVGGRKQGLAPGFCNEPFNGSLALARIGHTAPSPEQIKKMYEDEKCLFQENAKATLYGSSDAVTALAFDDTTNLLHVGTSAGRSEFQGLRRINNTTDAVTTAISASNGLVAEQ